MYTVLTMPFRHGYSEKEFRKMAMKYCTNCGAAMPLESKFCTECGTPFPKADKEETQPGQKPQDAVQPQ